MEKARVANIVGILVGTLGVEGFAEAARRIRALAEAAGKKTYTAVVGKPTVAKLGNFPEVRASTLGVHTPRAGAPSNAGPQVEVWVHIASPQGVLLDSREFLAPIITPFEAEVAFRDLDWPHGRGYRLDLAPVTEDGAGTTSRDSPRFSLLSGQVVGGGRESPAGSSDAIVALTDRALSLRGSDGAIVARSAADYLLAKRTYQVGGVRVRLRAWGEASKEKAVRPTLASNRGWRRRRRPAQRGRRRSWQWRAWRGGRRCTQERARSSSDLARSVEPLLRFILQERLIGWPCAAGA